MVLGALQGWPSGLGCWDGWRHGWSAWAVVSSGAGGGRRSYAVIFCSLPLSSPLSPSPDRRLPGCRRWGWLWCLAGRWLCMGAGVPGSLGWVQGWRFLLALHPLRLCWVLALPCVLWCWLSPGSCWPLLGVECLGAAGCWLWLRLGFPGSRLSALVQGWRVSRPCRWWWLGWVMGRRWAWWLAYPVRQIAQIKPCRFGYYSREKR